MLLKVLRDLDDNLHITPRRKKERERERDGGVNVCFMYICSYTCAHVCVCVRA